MAKPPKMYIMQGDKEFKRMLSALDAKFDDLKEFHLDLAELVMARALSRAPVRTGRLRETIRASGTKTAGRVRAGFKRVPYAGVIHFGWPARRIQPQPFLYDALDQRRNEVFNRYFDGIKKIQRKAGL